MNVLKRIWDKVKEYKASIIVYFIMLTVSAGCDFIIGDFNPHKYISLNILFIIFTALNIVRMQNKKYIIENGKLLFSKEDIIFILICDKIISISIIIDVIFMEFNIFKYIIYAVFLIILIILLFKKYKEKIKDSEPDINTKIV